MPEKTTKADLIEALTSKGLGSAKEAHAFIDDLFAEMKHSLLSGKTIELRGFGTFEIKRRKGRSRARNPKTGETVSVADHGVVSFRAGRELKRDAWGSMESKQDVEK